MRTYSATVTEDDDGRWFIRLDNSTDSSHWENVWGARAVFHSNRRDLAISGISIEMEGE